MDLAESDDLLGQEGQRLELVGLVESLRYERHGAQDTTPPILKDALTAIKDPDGAEIRALGRLVDFTGQRVLEVGSGEGRMTWRYAGATRSVVAVEPDAESVALARAEIPPELADRVSFRLLDVTDLDEPAGIFDVAFLSWSL